MGWQSMKNVVTCPIRTNLPKENAVASLKYGSIAPYPARFPTLSSVFYLFSLFINYGVQLGRSGALPADSKEALISLYVFVLVGLIPFVFSGGLALALRISRGKSKKSLSK